MYRICTSNNIVVQIVYNVNMNTQIGKKLKDLRQSVELTQHEFAEKLGLSRVNYTRYETDVSKPDYDTLIKIADFYNISLDYIFEREPFCDEEKRRFY